jgi:predicted dehydrogenase
MRGRNESRTRGKARPHGRSSERTEGDRHVAAKAGSRRRGKDSRGQEPLRFAVVGLGHIAQVAVLPAFANTKGHAVLAALVSDDELKLRTLGKKYRVPPEHRYRYAEFATCLKSVDAVYLALPNALHASFTIRAARTGVHVLCEKPMAVTERECERMIDAVRGAGVTAMIAYRLHYEPATAEVLKLVRSGDIGEVRAFHSTFTMNVVDRDNIRLSRRLGGGPLYDIGIYVLNAARMVFRAEPIEVAAFGERGRDERFEEVDEMTSAILRYPGGRLASFTTSFGAADVSMFEVVGTKGTIRVEPAFEYAEGLAFKRTVDGKSKRKQFNKGDQFAPELVDFANCVRRGKRPEPSLEEGLHDVHIIRALLRSQRTHRSVRLALHDPRATRAPQRVIVRPPVKKPTEVHARAPGKS